MRNNETVNYGKLVSNVHCAIRGVVLGVLTGKRPSRRFVLALKTNPQQCTPPSLWLMELMSAVCVYACVLIAGGVVAPLAAVAGLLRLAIRPALLGMAAHGFTRWLTRNHIGAAAILKKLQSGTRIAARGKHAFVGS